MMYGSNNPYNHDEVYNKRKVASLYEVYTKRKIASLYLNQLIWNILVLATINY